MSTNLTRIFVISGATFGSMVGAFVAILKLLPERASVIIGYQLKSIESLQAENAKQAHSMANMEIELEHLKSEIKKCHEDNS